jgi:hypothetical protein
LIVKMWRSSRAVRNVAIMGCYVRGQTRFGVYVEPFAEGVRWPMILQEWSTGAQERGFASRCSTGMRDILREKCDRRIGEPHFRELEPARRLVAAG